MSSSPRKKKKYQSSKADCDSEVNKASKECPLLLSNTDNKGTLKRENFIKAVQLVSQNAYFNYAERFCLLYMPICMNKSYCTHITKDGVFQSKAKEMPKFVKDLFKFEIKANKWCDALEVCILAITPTQYLPAIVLQDIFEIVLNIHEDLSLGYTTSQVIEKCKLVLSTHFSMHCPCIDTDIRKVYTQFLTSPMDPKNNTYSNRAEFGSDKGIVQFCLNRLEYELSSDSLDGPLLNKCDIVPDDMKQSITGLFWQKKKFDIFEMLERPHRIERLMIVMQSIIELLQFDLAIFQHNRDSNIKMRDRKTLIESILWRETGEIRFITNSFKQIMIVFCYFIHLEYPEEHIKTMNLWLNMAIETFYIYKNKQPNDYPNFDNRFSSLTNDFYEIFSDLPPKSITNILEKIQPPYLRHQISHLHSRTLLYSDEADTMRLLDNFYKNSKWNDFPQNDMIIKQKSIKRPRPNKLLKSLSKICKSTNLNDTVSIMYQKFSPSNDQYEKDQNYIIQTLYIALKAYLDAYSIQKFQETLAELNDKLEDESITLELKDSNSSIGLRSHQAYNTSKVFIKKYRFIINSFQELIMTIKEKLDCEDKPQSLSIFERLLDLN